MIKFVSKIALLVTVSSNSAISKTADSARPGPTAAGISAGVFGQSLSIGSGILTYASIRKMLPRYEALLERQEPWHPVVEGLVYVGLDFIELQSASYIAKATKPIWELPQQIFESVLPFFISTEDPEFSDGQRIGEILANFLYYTYQFKHLLYMGITQVPTGGDRPPETATGNTGNGQTSVSVVSNAPSGVPAPSSGAGGWLVTGGSGGGDDGTPPVWNPIELTDAATPEHLKLFNLIAQAHLKSTEIHLLNGNLSEAAVAFNSVKQFLATYDRLAVVI